MPKIPVPARALAVAAGPLLLLSSLFAAAPGQTVARTLTGQVLDRHREPLRGAVVLVQQEGTTNVTSYITDRYGNFSFKRLSDSVDYKVTATFRGRSAKAKELSHFDSKPDKIIIFVINLE